MFKCLLLVIIGYCVAKMFYNSCNCSNGVRNGFSVGAGVCPDGTCELPEPDQDFCYEKVTIPSISNEPSCYNTEHPPALVKSSYSCNERDGIEILRDIPALPGHEGKQNWRRCLRIDNRNDPRTYKCDPASKKCIVTNADDPDGVRKTQCQQYCDVTMAACMTKDEFGKEYEVEGIKGFKCRELTLHEKKDYIVNHTVTNISPGKQVYIGPDALEQCRAAGCGFNCTINGNIGDCEPNTESNVGYKDHGTCMSNCRIVYTCDDDGNGCYGCQPHPLTKVKFGKAYTDQPGECEKELCDKTWTCDGNIGECECGEPNQVGGHSTQEICQMDCKAQNMYEYRCPSDPTEYKMGGSKPGCAEFLCKDSGCGPYGFDSNAISGGAIGILEDNCNSGSPAGYNIKDEGDRNALSNVNGTRDNNKPCNLACSTEDRHFRWGKCTKIGNLCRKKGTIKQKYAPTGIYSNDNCDIPNKICSASKAISDGCTIDCTISEPSASGCIVDIDESQCYYDMIYKDVYGRTCPERTHQISCVGLDKQSDLWRGNLKNASDCDLFGSVEDLKTQLEKLYKVVANNASDITSLKGRVDTLEKKFKNLETNVSGIHDAINNLDIQFKKLQQEFDTFKKNVNELESNIQNDIKDLHTNASALSDHVNTLDTNVSGLHDDISSVGGRVDGLETNVSGLYDDISSVGGRVDAFEESGLYDKVGKLNHNVANNTRILAGYHRRIFTIKTSINSFIETVNGYLPNNRKINHI
tara:strand:+ start:6358 stop:8610 length:2253 start_codon:yes stop_codon:yes gene_type:complete